MRYRFVAAAVVLLALGPSAGAQYARYEPEWNRPVAPHRIAGNVYYVGTNELSVVLVTTPAGHVLIEAGFDETVPHVREGIRTLGFRYEDVRVLLTSQAHFDHAAGLARIKRETGARLEAMGDDAALLEAGGKGDFRFGDDLTFPPVRVDRVLEDGDRVSLGGFTIVARHTPGHTKGSATYVMTVEDDGRPYELVYAASTTVNPGTPLVGNPRYPAIVEDWERTYGILRSLRPDIWVGSHAAFFDLEGKRARAGARPNPYVDPEGYRAYVRKGEDRFREELVAARAADRGDAR